MRKSFANPFQRLVFFSAFFASATALLADIQVVTGHHSEGAESFTFTNVPPPSKNDAATKAKFVLLDGDADFNGGGTEQLHDGKVPSEADEPSRNFFFAAGASGGRIRIDLDHLMDVKQVNTYSWHPDTRGPQVYKLYGSDDLKTREFKSGDPTRAGWKLITVVDTRKSGGGQYGVSISDSAGILGKYQSLLFDFAPTEVDDDFGNTFYSEIDVVEAGAPVEPVDAAAVAPFILKSADGYCEIKIDTAKAPELKVWAEQKLAPALAEWYPKIVTMLSGEGFKAPNSFSLVISPGKGVAATGGTRITANSSWLKNELDGEAVGALIHEEVHVIQQYGSRRNGSRPPNWLVEGIPDYIRFFKFEPQSHGADIVWLRSRRNIELNYDKLYRISANFLDYVITHYDHDQKFLAKVNAACRDGSYTDEMWRDLTGKSLLELNDEWKIEVKKQLGPKAESPASASVNKLTEAEQAAGWKLLFNGVDFTGWHNFKHEGVRPGWQVKDGLLVCADPHDAGDLVTTEKFDAFELELDYNISEGGNSGIIFHVTDEGGAVWATGPEFQLEDNAKAADPQRCGWLYGLYQPADDPKTGKPIDATKPAGMWNHIRLVISPQKCEHYMNGAKYFEYVIGSEDFNKRVAASKFARMPLFAKSGAGYLALQGDHGQVSFRNIKIRSLPVAGKS